MKTHGVFSEVLSGGLVILIKLFYILFMAFASSEHTFISFPIHRLENIAKSFLRRKQKTNTSVF